MVVGWLPQVLKGKSDYRSGRFPGGARFKPEQPLVPDSKIDDYRIVFLCVSPRLAKFTLSAPTTLVSKKSLPFAIFHMHAPWLVWSSLDSVPSITHGSLRRAGVRGGMRRYKDPVEALVSRYGFGHCMHIQGDCGPDEKSWPKLDG